MDKRIADEQMERHDDISIPLLNFTEQNTAVLRHTNIHRNIDNILNGYMAIALQI